MFAIQLRQCMVQYNFVESLAIFTAQDFWENIEVQGW